MFKIIKKIFISTITFFGSLSSVNSLECVSMNNQECKVSNIKDDMVNIKDFHSNLLNIERKSHEDIDIYYIGYIMIKKFDNYKNIHSANPLYLIINSATEYFKEKNGKKYLVLDSTERYKKFFLELYQKLKHLMDKKNNFMKKLYRN